RSGSAPGHIAAVAHRELAGRSLVVRRSRAADCRHSQAAAARIAAVQIAAARNRVLDRKAAAVRLQVAHSPAAARIPETTAPAGPVPAARTPEAGSGARGIAAVPPLARPTEAASPAGPPPSPVAAPCDIHQRTSLRPLQFHGVDAEFHVRVEVRIVRHEIAAVLKPPGV